MVASSPEHQTPSPPVATSCSSDGVSPDSPASTLVQRALQTSDYLTFPMTYAVSGIFRRLSSDTFGSRSRNSSPTPSSIRTDIDFWSAPLRKASPFQPPPLTPLTLAGWNGNTNEDARILTRTLAEEIRLLVPPRLQLVSEWNLIYSLEQNGTSLSMLYEKCEEYRGRRGGFVLVLRDGLGGTFGAYLSDALHKSPHYYGTGECFLWRASILSHILDMSQLPPPPSADTTHLQRQTTLPAPLSAKKFNRRNGAGTSTPESIRFKAFPYSGVNEYMIYCEQKYLSVGGGDGRYGLWVDDNLDKGVSSTCLTFGNEPLSDEGKKFDVMGLELWYLGV